MNIFPCNLPVFLLNFLLPLREGHFFCSFAVTAQSWAVGWAQARGGLSWTDEGNPLPSANLPPPEVPCVHQEQPSLRFLLFLMFSLLICNIFYFYLID